MLSVWLAVAGLLGANRADLISPQHSATRVGAHKDLAVAAKHLGQRALSDADLLGRFGLGLVFRELAKGDVGHAVHRISR